MFKLEDVSDQPDFNLSTFYPNVYFKHLKMIEKVKSSGCEYVSTSI